MSALLTGPQLTQAAIAPRQWPYGGCGDPYPDPEEQKLCEEEERSYANELAKEAAEVHSREAAEQAPAAFLEIKVRSYHGSSYREPGETFVTIRTSPYAAVGFQAQRPVRFDGEGIKRTFGGRTGAAGEELLGIEWTCAHPAETIRYEVEARGGSGPPLLRTGRFRISISSRWCAAARHREIAESRQEAAEDRQREATRHRREAEQRQREIEHFESNCRAIGGIPVQITTRYRNQRVVVCHSKTGGIIPVP